MSRTVKNAVSVLLSLIVFLSGLAAVPSVRASALSMIKYSVAYKDDTVRLTLKPRKSTDTICYTANGTAPTKKSAVYKKVLSSRNKVTIRAVEYNKSGKKVASLKIVIKPRVQTPTFSVSVSGGSAYLTIKTATSGAEIYYTLDGSKPTKSSKLYSGKIKYRFGTTVRARAYKSSMKASKTAEYSSSEEDSGNYAEQVNAIITEERAAVGLSALTLDPELCKAADIRAKELAALFDHTRPDGSDCSTVLDELGIRRYASGENIAYGMGMLFTSAEVMDGWMHSSGHRANILRSYFGKVGVGRYVVGNRVYWVQVFTD